MKTLRGCNFELLFIQNGSFYPKEKNPEEKIKIGALHYY